MLDLTCILVVCKWWEVAFVDRTVSVALVPSMVRGAFDWSLMVSTDVCGAQLNGDWFLHQDCCNV